MGARRHEGRTAEGGKAGHGTRSFAHAEAIRRLSIEAKSAMSCRRTERDATRALRPRAFADDRR